MIRNRKPKIFYGYIIALSGFVSFGVLFGGLHSFGVFFEPILAEFGWTRATISGAYSLSLVLSGFLGMGTGRLTDRFGSRSLITIGGLLLGIGYILLSQANAVWQLYLLYGVIIGISISCILIPTLSTMARWFIKRRGMMTGLVIAGTGVGMIAMPLLADRLISGYGWRTSFIVFGAISFVIIILAAQFLRRDPQSKGQLPDGDTEISPDTSRLEAVGISFRGAIQTRQLWMLTATYFCEGFFVYTILVHIVIHATGLGIPASSAVNILPIIGGLNIAGRIVLGSIVDRIGSRSTLIASFTVLIASVVWLQFAKELWMLYLFAAIFGFSYGGLHAVISPMVGELFGLSSHGVILGLVNAGITTGGTIGPILIGFIFDVTGSYQTGFLILAIVSAIGLIIAVLLKPIKTPLPNPPRTSL